MPPPDTTKHTEAIRNILRDALQLGARADALNEQSGLLGHVPEFDSMAVVTVIGMIEDQFGITVNDDDVSAEVFETLGSLSRFVAAKTGR
jgi:acyl carrier protein